MPDDTRYQAAQAALSAKRYEWAYGEFSALATAGYPPAWITLGWMHQHAAGVPKNLTEAEQCYRRAIELGSLPANFFLARLFVEENNYPDALPLFLKAADDGHTPSMYWAGDLYLNGKGTDKDIKNAERYLKLAVDRGHVYARRDYYRAKLRGEFGKREVFSSLAGWLKGLWDAPIIMGRDPNSELLQ